MAARILGAMALLLGLGAVLLATPASADPPLTYQAIPAGTYPIDVAPSQDGAWLFVISRGDGGVADLRVYDAATLAQVNLVVFGPGATFNPTSVELSTDGSQVWVSFYNPGEIRIYPTADLVAGAPAVPTVLTGGGGFVDLEPDPSSDYMYAATLFNPQYQFDATDLAAVPRTASLPNGSRGVAVRTDGTQVYFTQPVAAPNGGVATVDVAVDGTLTAGPVTITGDVPWGVTYSAAVDRVVSSNSGTPTSISGFTPGAADVNTVPISCGPRLLDTTPDGERVYVACLTGGILTNDYTTGVAAQIPVGANVEAVDAFGPAGGDAERVYATSGGTDEVLVFTKATVDAIADQSVATGAEVSFATVVNDFWQTLQWQRSTDGGVTWVDVAGATTESIDVGAVTVADSGSQFRLVARSGLFDDVISAPATLTVAPPPPTPTPTASPAPTPEPSGVLAVTGSAPGPSVAAAVGLVGAGAAAVLLAAGHRRRADREQG